jgi:pimeloyl-ACP methyl ester carboxylesterase
MGARRALLLAADHPARVEGAVFIAPAVPLAAQTPRARAVSSFDQELESYEGWAKYNRHHWLNDFPDFLLFFFSQIFTEPHSTKQIEDSVGWALQTTPETLIATQLAPAQDEAAIRELAARVSCPVLVIHGSEDAVRSHESGAALAELTGGTFVSLEGSGHAPHARDPVKVNLLLRDLSRPRRPLGCHAAAPLVSARSTSRRRSASHTPGATSRSPTSCACCIRISRSTGWRNIR